MPGRLRYAALGQRAAYAARTFRPEVVYVFVVTYGAGQEPEFFAVSRAALRTHEKRLWGKWDRTYKKSPGHRGIYPAALAPWKNWDAIRESE